MGDDYDFECEGCSVEGGKVILDDGIEQATVTIPHGNAMHSVFTIKYTGVIIPRPEPERFYSGQGRKHIRFLGIKPLPRV